MSLHDRFDVIQRYHGPETRGPWRIEYRDLEPPGPLEALRAALKGGRGLTAAGTYIGLHRGGTLVMSDTDDERRDHYEPLRHAEMRGGRVLIHGLGLGMFAHAVLSAPKVRHVDVVEIDADLIALVGPKFQAEQDAGRLTIHHGDALRFKWPVGTRWSVVWHDIWDSISADDDLSRTRLHRKFGHRCDWQGSWAREYVHLVR